MGTVLTQYSTRVTPRCWTTPNPTISCPAHLETAVIASFAKRAVNLIRNQSHLRAMCASGGHIDNIGDSDRRNFYHSLSTRRSRALPSKGVCKGHQRPKTVWRPDGPAV